MLRGIWLATFADDIGRDVFLIGGGVAILALVHWVGRTMAEHWNGFRIACYLAMLFWMVVGAALLRELGGFNPVKAKHVFWVCFICLSISSLSGLVIGFSKLDRKRINHESKIKRHETDA